MPSPTSPPTTGPGPDRRSRALRRRLGAIALIAGLVAASCSSGDDDDAVAVDDALNPSAEDLDAGADVEGSRVEATYDTFDGGTASLADYRGSPLVVNFFAAWCPPCIAEMPDFQAVYEELDGEVAFLGMSQDATTDDALDLVERTGVAYDLGWDPDAEVFRRLGGLAMPTTVFIDADGEVVEVVSGALTAPALRDRIETIT